MTHTLRWSFLFEMTASDNNWILFVTASLIQIVPFHADLYLMNFSLSFNQSHLISYGNGTSNQNKHLSTCVDCYLAWTRSSYLHHQSSCGWSNHGRWSDEMFSLWCKQKCGTFPYQKPYRKIKSHDYGRYRTHATNTDARLYVNSLEISIFMLS